ncbi:hypothetical protein [Aurantivibrio plasticivorans]
MSKEYLLKNFLSICILSVSLSACATDNDFNKVCSYFVELISQSDIEKLTHLQKNDFIFSKIDSNLAPNSDAAAAWKAISSAESSQRYMLFQSAASDSLKSDWQCLEMEKLAPKTGQFE